MNEGDITSGLLIFSACGPIVRALQAASLAFWSSRSSNRSSPIKERPKLPRGGAAFEMILASLILSHGHWVTDSFALTSLDRKIRFDTGSSPTTSTLTA